MTQGDHWNLDEDQRVRSAVDVLQTESKSVAVLPDLLTAEAELKVRIALSAMDVAIQVHGHIARNDTKAAVLEMMKWADTLPKDMLSAPETPVDPAWRAVCGVCDARWMVTHDESGRALTAEDADNPGPHGTFCPDCRQRGMIAPGVLHWSFTS